jgi:hypothetical protein
VTLVATAVTKPPQLSATGRYEVSVNLAKLFEANANQLDPAGYAANSGSVTRGSGKVTICELI